MANGTTDNKIPLRMSTAPQNEIQDAFYLLPSLFLKYNHFSTG